MSVSEELERLQSLRDKGVLNESEFVRAKARVLGDATTAPDHSSFLHKLSRSSSDRVVGGVCGGLGRHTGLPSWAWRVVFCVTTLYAGLGLLFYILLWIFIPADNV